MSFVYPLMCFFGFHDWFIAEKRVRIVINDGNGWVLLLGLVTAMMGIAAFVTTLFALIPPDNGQCLPPIYSVITVSVEAFLGLVWLFLFRNEYRMDARCLRCGKQKLELSHRNNAVHEARRFFANYKKIDQDASNWTDSSTGQ